MVFYEIELKGIPKIRIACSVEYLQYKRRFEQTPNYLEIALCEKGRIVYNFGDGSSIISTPRMLIPFFSDTACDASPYMGELQRHTTVVATVEYEMKRRDTEETYDLDALYKKIKSGNTVLIPYHFETGDAYDDILYSLKKISGHFQSDTPSGGLNAISAWYKLAGQLTEMVFSHLTRAKLCVSPIEFNYAEKATKYLLDNYTSKILVSDVAAHIGISEGYLHRIFKKVKGVSINDYLNKHRISAALSLIEEHRLSLKEAALNTGIEDASYMSRLFKKETGLSYKEYKKIKQLSR